MRRFRGFVHIAQAKRLAFPGAYMTDERTLFRVLARRTIAEETLVELEDCATLDVWLVTMSEVARMRVVRARDCDRGRDALPVNA